MLFYLVRDNSNWLSSSVFKSQKDAIISQRWRLENPALKKDSDYPISIMQVDTDLGNWVVVKYLNAAQLEDYVEKYDSQKKGGAK